MHPATSDTNTSRKPLATRRRSCAGGRRFGRCGFGLSELHRRANRRPSGITAWLQQLAPRPAVTSDRGVHPAEMTVHQEIFRGATIGMIACLVMVGLAGATPFGALVAVIWGSCFGALIGLLLWVGSAAMPEEPVVPPSPRQARGEPSDKPRQRP